MSVDIARIAFSQKEYRTVSVSESAVQTRHPLAIALIYNTLIKNELDAQSFGQSVLDLRKLDRYTWAALVNSTFYPNIAVGKTVTIAYPRHNLDAGKDFIVKRLKKSLDTPFVELSLFGPRT